MTLINNLKYSIHSIDEIDNAEWNTFLKLTNESTFFCSIDWCKVYRESHILQVRNSKNELVAGIPFRFLTVLPFIGKYYKFVWLDSSVLVNDCLEPDHIIQLKKLTFLHLLEFLKQTRAIVLFISPKVRSFDGEIFKEIFGNSDHCATFYIDLTRDLDSIYNSFSVRKRRSIRKANEKGVETKFFYGDVNIDLINEYYYLQKKMFDHKNKYFSSIYIKSKEHLKSVLSSDNAYLAIAYYNHQPVAGSILLTHNSTIMYYLGASDNKMNKLTNSSSLLHYETIKFAKEKGLKMFDLGGTLYRPPKPEDDFYGVYKFKKEFGGEQYNYDCASFVLNKYRYHFIWWLRKYETNSIAAGLYNLLLRRRRF